MRTHALPSDSITYYALVVGIMKAGFTAFPISTRNSADGIAHLLAKTSSRLLFASADAAVARLAEASCSIFAADNEGVCVPRVVVPAFEYFYNASPQAGEAVPTRVISDPSTTPCVIIHSSGTVSFPKPIYLTYQMFFEHGNQVGKQIPPVEVVHDLDILLCGSGLEGDLCCDIISTHGMPMFRKFPGPLSTAVSLE
jgi:acyl-CoA synthetase (AMP-forming)/AMP-acid ligase II